MTVGPDFNASDAVNAGDGGNAQSKCVPAPVGYRGRMLFLWRLTSQRRTCRPGGKCCQGILRRRWSIAERGIRSDAVAVSQPALDENLSLMVGQCPLLALSGHFMSLGECPLLGVKRTCLTQAQMSASDPKRTLSLVSRLSPTGSGNDLAASLYTGLRSASASSDADQCAPDSDLETGIASGAGQ